MGVPRPFFFNGHCCSYGAMPYPSLKSVEVQRRVREGLRLEQPPNTSNEYHSVGVGQLFAAVHRLT